jgi:tetratricopeptide (TPR) repeat protein
MRKGALFTILTAVVLTAGLALSCGRSGEWTSSSEEAVREFELGLDSRMKLYGVEAREHFERALELDPSFVAAKLALIRYSASKERGEALLEDLRSTSPKHLTDRERFLLEYTLARRDGRYSEATVLLEEYVGRAPKDPFGVNQLAEEAWLRQDWEAAEAAYERLLELDPNWVTAQNRLGYMAMAVGKFEEAEERFLAYRFVAPDQANPHDSMGELLTVVGRYDEALAELEEAVAIRPDFCASYMHMLDVLILDGRPYDGYRVLERAESNCDEAWEEQISRARCEVAFWIDYLNGEFETPWREDRQACLKRVDSFSFLIHRMAAVTGRTDTAVAIEDEYAQTLEKRLEGAMQEAKALRGILGHLQGVRQLAEGRTGEAIETMRKADESLFYWGQDQGILKLFNRLNLAYALESADREKEAQQVLEQVKIVNPAFADAYEDIAVVFSE